jgi:predicted HTH transcriptional regulator
MALDQYGSDVSTFPDLDVTGRGISDKRSVAEAVLRRWTTEEAQLEYDRDAGFDLRDLLNEDLSASDLRRYAARAGIEAEKDERIQRMTVTMELDASKFTLTVRAVGVLLDDRDFSLTASITQISADLLEVS